MRIPCFVRQFWQDFLVTSSSIRASRPVTQNMDMDGETSHILPLEREKASFAVEEMTNILDNGAEQTKKRRFIVGMSDGMYDNVEDKYNWDRATYLSEHVKGFIEIHEDFVGKWKPTRDELVWMSEYAMNSGPLWNTLGTPVRTHALSD